MMQIRAAATRDVDDWLSLRLRLWPNTSLDEHQHEIAQQLRDPRRYISLLAYGDDGKAAGLAEIALRFDPVNGCVSSPVAFLEGIYVEPEQRRRGVARALCEQAQSWAVQHDCSEFAADALLDDIASRNFHQAVGFTATERVIYFRKELK